MIAKTGSAFPSIPKTAYSSEVHENKISSKVSLKESKIISAKRSSAGNDIDGFTFENNIVDKTGTSAFMDFTTNEDTIKSALTKNLLYFSFDDLYASANSLTSTSAELAISNALSGGITQLKQLHIIGSYKNGVF